jgi:hypothetical protein
LLVNVPVANQSAKETIMPHTTLSTGVMLRDNGAFNANIIILNLDPKVQRTVTVKIFDWGVEQLWSAPAPVTIDPAAATTIGPHTQRAFIALITQSTAQPSAPLNLYEIRVTVDNINDLIVNCFAINSSGLSIPGKTVWHKDMVVVPAL